MVTYSGKPVLQEGRRGSSVFNIEYIQNSSYPNLIGYLLYLIESTSELKFGFFPKILKHCWKLEVQ